MSAVRKVVVARPDAVEILTEDHDRVKNLFQAFERAMLGRDNDAKKEIVDEISNELSIHSRIEEEIFYQAARKFLQVHYLLDEAEFEHASMTEIISQLRELHPSDVVYDRKVLLLRDYVNHHVIKEEEKIFPKVRRTNIDLQILGDELIQRRRELLLEYRLDEL
jgi:iron-sulfur cluster repair protein YtfE (RIC family)